MIPFVNIFARNGVDGTALLPNGGDAGSSSAAAVTALTPPHRCNAERRQCRIVHRDGGNSSNGATGVDGDDGVNPPETDDTTLKATIPTPSIRRMVTTAWPAKRGNVDSTDNNGNGDGGAGGNGGLADPTVVTAATAATVVPTLRRQRAQR